MSEANQERSEESMTQLETHRLILRAVVPDDAKDLHEVFKDAEAMRYWSEPPHKDIERTQEWIASMMKGPNGTTDFVICLKEADNKPIGKNGVWSGDEIGFILHRSQWGKGLAKEAVTKILPYLFDVRKMENITSDVDPRNQASIGLLKKFGFEEVGYREKTFQIGEEWVDSVDLKLSKEQWQRHSVS